MSASVLPGSTSTYDRNGLINITRPTQSKIDDLLFLFLSRSDDGLPVNLTDWKPVASCLKRHNSVRNCETIDECSEKMWEEYCYAGADLVNTQTLNLLLNSDNLSFILSGNCGVL